MKKQQTGQLLEAAVWKEPLVKFAKATGLSIGLYDSHLNRCFDIITLNPIGERLVKAGFWEEQGLGSQIDREAAKKALQGNAVYSTQLDMFSHLAFPLAIDKKVLGIFIIGWIPDRFADPVTSDILSKKIGAAPMELWQLLRMQQPVSQEKLETHARMLETFSVPLIRQLLVQADDRDRAYRSKIVSETALSFTRAVTESEIAAEALKSIQSLMDANSVFIEIVKIKGEAQERTKYGGSLKPQGETHHYLGVQSHLEIPIPSAQGTHFGMIEIKFSDPELSEDLMKDLKLIATQLGTALQKVHLIQTLEKERSALRGANLELQHMHKMKDEFLATVSHELRTPLNAILGWAQILRDKDMQFEEFERGMETIERNAKNQSNLIEDLLDVSRIISGKMTLEREDIEATAILKQSLETVFPMIEARHQKLHLQISSTPIFLKGDAIRITQIFWNILSNASKFTPEGGNITVVLENAGHYFRFEVSDSGKGISPEFLPSLFNRFSQADGSFTRRHGGLGLGLAIVRHLVELHGGTVTATSPGEGKGSTFSVFMPQNTTDLELDSAYNMTRPAGGGENQTAQLEGVKILLVDDEPDSLRLTRFVLEKRGASVEMADTAEQGFQKLRDWHPDVLISDISMPDESGYELMKRVRFLSPEEGGNTLSVALTALAGVEQKELALDAGFQLHLAKPFEPNVLARDILQLLKSTPH